MVFKKRRWFDTGCQKDIYHLPKKTTNMLKFTPLSCRRNIPQYIYLLHTKCNLHFLSYSVVLAGGYFFGNHIYIYIYGYDGASSTVGKYLTTNVDMYPPSFLGYQWFRIQFCCADAIIQNGPWDFVKSRGTWSIDWCRIFVSVKDDKNGEILMWAWH